MNLTGDEATDKLIEELYEVFEGNDLEAAHDKMEEVRDYLRESPHLIKWITEPVNITDLHKKLIENFEVPQKAMQLRHRVPNRTRRAMLFAQAMINGIKRTQN